MANMEFLKANTLITTGSFFLDSGHTATINFIFDRNTKLKFTTSGYSSNTSTVISYEFDNPTVISHILVQNHNLKQFRAFYNSATANTFSVDVNETQNSATSSYYAFNSVTVSSVQLQLDAATAADTEKSIGELIVTERRVQFERNPSTDNFRPRRRGIREKHKMPDGGVTLFNIQTKYKANLEWQFITSSFTSILETIYDEALPIYFIPFPTTTSWDGKAFEMVWTNDSDFRHSDNAKTQGFEGRIFLEETSNA